MTQVIRPSATLPASAAVRGVAKRDGVQPGQKVCRRARRQAQAQRGAVQRPRPSTVARMAPISAVRASDMPARRVGRGKADIGHQRHQGDQISRRPGSTPCADIRFIVASGPSGTGRSAHRRHARPAMAVAPVVS